MKQKENNKHRILVVIRWPVGGIRTFIRYVYNNFNRTKYHFTIIAPDSPELNTLLDDLRDFDLTRITLKNKPSGLEVLVSIFKVIVVGHFDLIHSHGFTAGAFAAVPALFTGTKHLMTSHDVFLPEQFTGLKGLIKKRALSILLRMVDIIHSVSYDAQNNLINFLPSLNKGNGRCIVIPNGIEIDRFKSSDKRDFRKDLNLSEDTFLIGFLGRFMSQKGFIYLIHALELILEHTDLPKKPLILTFGYGGFVREDRQLIKRKGLDNYFYFLPFEPNISASLKGLDVVVMPSLWEACPLIPMEAMVAGVPIIGTNCIGLREVLKHSPGVMVEPRDSISLANAIEEEIRNPSVLKAEAFRKEAEQRFDVKKQAKNLEQTISHLISKR